MFQFLWNLNIYHHVGFEVLMAVSMKMAVFWVAVMITHHPDDGGSKDL
jgi:hypothetical protein